MDNNPSLRLWAEKYNELLHGSLNRYLMGTESLEEALVEVVERLYLQQDLSLIRFYLDRAMKDLTDDPEHKVSLEYLEHIHTLVENKIVARVTGTTPESPAAPFGDGYGILSDRAIRRLSGEGGMIEPFNERQVTRTEGKPSISHGLSSYGYDARVAPEFKVFTNVYGAEIDPKNFDAQSFVDVRANPDGFIRVPPNSFALGRTMEYFRIPRDVLVICLGKSTYARCFGGDTRVALVDGSAPTLEELARNADKGPVWGYAMGPYGRVQVSLLDAPRCVGRDTLIEVTLDNDRTIQVTPDHKFILRDGKTLAAGDLRPGHSLMPLYRDLFRGYEEVYQPVQGFMEATHRLADEWNVRNGIYPATEGCHRHHKDHDRRNNNPWNIERMIAADHIRHHNGEFYGEDFDADAHGIAIKTGMARRAMEPGWVENFARIQKDRSTAFWNDPRYEGARDRLRLTQAAAWTPDRRADAGNRMVHRYLDPAERIAQGDRMRGVWAMDMGDRRARQREHARGLRLRSDIGEKEVRDALQQTGSIRGAARILGCDRSVFNRFQHVVGAVVGRNHKVKGVKTLPGVHDVYCLTVPEGGNFGLDAGVFVENCGIIVNVTPLEPEWEGHVTLEFSNTTPLPARIYAGEGACQFIFLRGSDPCETSYRDRGGKYQGQTGVTPPRMK